MRWGLRVACNGDESPVLRLSWVAQLMYRDGIEVKNSWIYTSAPLSVFVAWCKDRLVVNLVLAMCTLHSCF